MTAAGVEVPDDVRVLLDGLEVESLSELRWLVVAGRHLRRLIHEEAEKITANPSPADV